MRKKLRKLKKQNQTKKNPEKNLVKLEKKPSQTEPKPSQTEKTAPNRKKSSQNCLNWFGFFKKNSV